MQIAIMLYFYLITKKKKVYVEYRCDFFSEYFLSQLVECTDNESVDTGGKLDMFQMASPLCCAIRLLISPN